MSMDPQATQKKETGAAFLFIGWFLLLCDIFFLMFLGEEIRAGNDLLKGVSIAVLVVGIAFVVIGRVKQRRGRRQLGL